MEVKFLDNYSLHRTALFTFWKDTSIKHEQIKAEFHDYSLEKQVGDLNKFSSLP